MRTPFSSNTRYHLTNLQDLKARFPNVHPEVVEGTYRRHLEYNESEYGPLDKRIVGTVGVHPSLFVKREALAELEERFGRLLETPTFSLNSIAPPRQTGIRGIIGEVFHF